MPARHLIIGLLLGVLAGCFAAPADAVLFSCERDGEDRCPPEYRCEADNCCHRIGSDVDANFGACALGGNLGESGSESGDMTETDTGTDTETGA